MKKTLIDRLDEKIVTSPGCWLWQAATTRGYGCIRIDGKSKYAHRVTYELLVGPIPEGLVLDHVVCQTPKCVNPHHLEPVTRGENVSRGRRHNLFKTECPRGHPYSEENTHIGPSGSRFCKACNRLAVARRRSR